MSVRVWGTAVIFLKTNYKFWFNVWSELGVENTAMREPTLSGLKWPPAALQSLAVDPVSWMWNPWAAPFELALNPDTLPVIETWPFSNFKVNVPPRVAGVSATESTIVTVAVKHMDHQNLQCKVTSSGKNTGNHRPVRVGAEVVVLMRSLMTLATPYKPKPPENMIRNNTCKLTKTENYGYIL